MTSNNHSIKVKCISCGKIFSVKDQAASIRIHAAKAAKVAPQGIFTPCTGSLRPGLPVL